MVDYITVNGKKYRVEVTWRVLMEYWHRSGVTPETKPEDAIDFDALIWAIWAAAKAGAKKDGVEFTLTEEDVEFAENGVELVNEFIPILTRQTAVQIPEAAKKK